MNTPNSEEKFAAKVRFALNLSANQISSDKLLRLERARNLALARRKSGSSISARLASAGSSLGMGGLFKTAAWATPALALVVGLVVLDNWQSQSETAEIAAVESAVLKDDLPIDAYLDKGFNRFLLQGE